MNAPGTASSSDRRDWTHDEPRLLLESCTRCSRVWYLPHAHCPACGGGEVTVLETSGEGRCVASTRVHVTAGEAANEPIGLVLVALEEGPVVMGRSTYDGDAVTLAPGDRAQLEFLPIGDESRLVPHFFRRT
jgi:uncharacterized protein